MVAIRNIPYFRIKVWLWRVILVDLSQLTHCENERNEQLGDLRLGFKN